jgi:2-polyprenyl-3-methyl-5-hydroxy-6-metoxy-1,4-benzoquinol methylase
MVDYAYAAFHLLKEKYSPFDPSWFREFRSYYDVKMTLPEFHVLYTLYRLDHRKAWSQRPRNTEEAIRSFYSEDMTKYHLFRAVYRHRLSSFYEILKYTPRAGVVCEYGCGIAPVTHFLVKRRPKASFTCVDIDSHMFKYARWRLADKPNIKFKSPGLGDVYPLVDKYDVITCLDVLEHVPDPLSLVEHLCEHLKPEGKLFINFIYAPSQENLESAAELRDETIDYLNEYLISTRALIKDDKTGQDGLYFRA